MSQSCEILVTKINEWQKAVLELEELADEFLSSRDDMLKEKIEDKKQEIIYFQREYQTLAYPELPNGENLFWPEKEALEEMLASLNSNLNLDLEHFIHENRLKVRDRYVEEIRLAFLDLSQLPKLNISLFQNLKKFYAWFCDLRKLPTLNRAIKEIRVNNNLDIEMPGDLSELQDLEIFNVWNCGLEKLPVLTASIKEINATDNSIPLAEQERIKKEYPDAEIKF